MHLANLESFMFIGMKKVECLMASAPKEYITQVQPISYPVKQTGLSFDHRPSKKDQHLSNVDRAGPSAQPVWSLAFLP